MPNDIWPEIKSQLLASGLDKFTITNWVESCEWKGITDGRLTLVAENKFVAECIIDREYSNTILRAAQLIEPSVTEVSIEYQGETNSDPLPTAEKASVTAVGTRVPRSSAVAALQVTTPKVGPVGSRYQGGDLVIGPANHFAVEICKEILNPNGRWKKLFLHGPQGRGKTLLATAAICRLRRHRNQNNKTPKIIKVRGNEFLNEFCATAKDSRDGGQRFDNKYKDVEFLVFDGLERVAGPTRCKTQQQLANLLDDLEARNMPVLIICTEPLAKLILVPDLASRLSGFISVPIDPPDAEMRFEIIKRKFEKSGLPQEWWPADEVLKMVANLETVDNRVLCGRVDNIVARCLFSKRSLTLEETQIAIGAEGATTGAITWERIYTALKEVYPDVIQLGGQDALKGKGRGRNLVFFRHLAMYLCLKLIPGIGKQEVGELFGRDRSTVTHGIERIEKANNHDLYERVGKICNQLGCIHPGPSPSE
jgi:chromosomal replication initiator protein